MLSISAIDRKTSRERLGRHPLPRASWRGRQRRRYGDLVVHAAKRSGRSSRAIGGHTNYQANDGPELRLHERTCSGLRRGCSGTSH